MKRNKMDEFISDTERTICNYKMIPEVAEMILKSNMANRSISPMHVRKYTQSMINRNWTNNYDPIIISKNGILLDGQHRLKACIIAQAPFLCDLRIGASDSHRFEMGGGKPRSPGDILKIEGYKNYNIVASMICFIVANEDGTMGWGGWRTSYDRKTLIDIVKGNEEALYEAATKSMSIYRHSGLQKSIAGFCHYTFSRIDKECADVFFEKLSTGVGMEDGDPVLALIRLLNTNARSVKKLHSRHIVAAVIYAWNATRRGKKIAHIKIDPAGPFPSIL